MATAVQIGEGEWVIELCLQKQKGRDKGAEKESEC